LIDNQLLTTIQTISNKLKQFQTTTYADLDMNGKNTYQGPGNEKWKYFLIHQNCIFQWGYPIIDYICLEQIP
jgi:hypothetical protein